MVASDRRFGLPHPFDAELTGETPRGRKPGLWEALRRALGTPPEAETPPPRISVPQEPAPGTPVVPARPAMPAPPTPDPGVEPSLVAPARVATAVEIDPGIPFLEAEPGEDEPPAVPAPPAARHETAPESGESPSGGASPPLPTPGGRLARGLASFSRDNAEREKKYAHLLRDAGSTGQGRSPGPRKRS